MDEILDGVEILDGENILGDEVEEVGILGTHKLVTYGWSREEAGCSEMLVRSLLLFGLGSRNSGWSGSVWGIVGCHFRVIREGEISKEVI